MFFTELQGALLQLLFFSAIPIIWWFFSAQKQESFFKWIGLKKVKFTGKIGSTLIITIIAITIYGLLTNFFLAGFEGVTNAGSQFAGKGLNAIPTVLVYAFIRTGLSEEILFRGFIGKRISSKYGFVVGNTIQAIIFGALHGIPFGLVTGNVLVTVCLTILPAAFGWFNGWLDEKRSGGSIVSSWILHGLINTLAACISL